MDTADLTYYGALLVALHAVTATSATVHALLYKSDSRAAFGWIGVVLFFPYAGAALYLLFGINRVRRKAQRRGIFGIPWHESGIVPPPAGVRDEAPAIELVGRAVTGRAPADGNSVDILIDGEAAFARMLNAIDRATRRVWLMSYIFDADETGSRFVRALRDAQTRGVEVRVLIDDIGRRYHWPGVLRDLRREGIDVRCFMPIRLLPPSLSLNLRNHRKLLVVDDALGFAGGMNIGNRQLRHPPRGHGAADLHFCFQGPVVRDFAALFAEDWQRSNGALLEVPDPMQSTTGPCRCRLVPDGPDNHLDHLSLLIDGVISSAQERIAIVTPYFLPHRKLVGALQSAALRGIDVDILVPERNNWPMVQWALGHILWELVNVGVRVHQQPDPFAHTKCIIIDDHYALVGSTNLDPRSLRLNFELGVEVLSRSFVHELAAHVDSLIAASRPITPDDVAGRSVLVRARDATAALFSPYL
ncbi:MAG: phospholipase D-like domain-containing protein [Pseudomonadota bacterium]